MTTAEITVAYINQPKAGKKRGTIKGTDNVLYGVFQDKLGSFMIGGTYSITYEESEFQGSMYKTIKSVQLLKAPGSSATAPRPSTGGSNTYRETSAVDAERMFVTALARAFIQAGHIQPERESVIRLTNALRDAWNQTYGAAAAAKAPARAPVGQQPDDEMSDSIPF